MDIEERLKYQRRRRQASRITILPNVRDDILTRDSYKCVLCGATKNLTIDHIISVYRGGSDNFDNLQTLCNRCNAGKLP